jgi:hypothetical protein
VRDWVLSIGGGPLVSLAISTNILSALTGSASGGLTIALDALGGTYLRLAAEQGIDPALLHRVAVIGAGTLDSLPHNGAVVTLLAVCGLPTPRVILTSSLWESSGRFSLLPPSSGLDRHSARFDANAIPRGESPKRMNWRMERRRAVLVRSGEPIFARLLNRSLHVFYYACPLDHRYHLPIRRFWNIGA